MWTRAEYVRVCANGGLKATVEASSSHMMAQILGTECATALIVHRHQCQHSSSCCALGRTLGTECSREMYTASLPIAMHSSSERLHSVSRKFEHRKSSAFQHLSIDRKQPMDRNPI